jgi:hypothetical protein
MLNDVYGIRGRLGDLLIEPRLKDVQFDASNKASARTVFAGRKLDITYINSDRRDYGSYAIKGITLDDRTIAFRLEEGAAVIDRADILKLDAGKAHAMKVVLG